MVMLLSMVPSVVEIIQKTTGPTAVETWLRSPTLKYMTEPEHIIEKTRITHGTKWTCIYSTNNHGKIAANVG